MQKLDTLAKEGKINENAGVKDGHSIIINAPIKKVWEILIDMANWPEWNDIVKKLKIEGEPEVGKNFQWNFDGTKFSAQIQGIAEPNTLTWTGKSNWSKSIHVWQLEDDDNQTIATLSASLQGTFSILSTKHQKVYNDLLIWLQRLKDKAEEE